METGAYLKYIVRKHCYDSPNVLSVGKGSISAQDYVIATKRRFNNVAGHSIPTGISLTKVLITILHIFNMTSCVVLTRRGIEPAGAV